MLSRLIQARNIRQADSLRSMICHVRSFSTLDREELEKVLSLAVEETTIDNQIVVHSGETLRRMLFVTRGQYQQGRKTLSGELHHLKTLVVGDYYAEQALFKDVQSDFLILSKGLSSFVSIDRHKF